MLPRVYRLQKEKDIKALFSKGKSVFDNMLPLKIRPNRLNETRFAVVVSGKVSKSAVVRNRIRRRIREILRLELLNIRPGYDIIISARSTSLGKTSKELKSHLLSVLQKAKVLKI